MTPPQNARGVEGYPGYMVARDGTVWSKQRGRWRELLGGLDKDGYRKVILCRAGERRYARVNVLVLEVHVGPAPAGMVCAHENNIWTDNRVENLRYDTQKNNIADKARHGTRQIGDRAPRRKLSEVQVRSILDRLATERVADLASEFLISKATIYAIKQGRIWSHLGVNKDEVGDPQVRRQGLPGPKVRGPHAEAPDVR